MIFGSLWARDLQLLALAYYVTDSERFASPKKKAKKVKIVRRSYPLEILPEVPSDVLEHVKTLAKNSLEDVEKRLIKLKFFNKTWLSNSDKIPANSENLLMPPIVSTDMPSPVLKAEEGSHMKVPEATFEETLGKESETAETKVKVEPVFSSVEVQNEFNEWYAKKVESNSIKKKIKKYEPSSPCPSVSTMPSLVPLLSTPSKPSKETDAFSSSRQVVNKKPMWVELAAGG